MRATRVQRCLLGFGWLHWMSAVWWSPAHAARPCIVSSAVRAETSPPPGAKRMATNAINPRSMPRAVRIIDPGNCACASVRTVERKLVLFARHWERPEAIYHRCVAGAQQSRSGHAVGYHLTRCRNGAPACRSAPKRTVPSGLRQSAARSPRPRPTGTSRPRPCRSRRALRRPYFPCS